MDMTIEQMLSNYAVNANTIGADAAKESFYSELDSLIASDSAMESPMGYMWGAVADNFASGTAGGVVAGIALIVPAILVSAVEIVLRIVGAALSVVGAIVAGVIALPILILALPVLGIAAIASARDSALYEEATEATSGKLNPTAVSAAKEYQKSLNAMLKNSFETSEMIAQQIETMKAGHDSKVEATQQQADKLKATFASVSKAKSSYDKAMSSVGATGKQKAAYWDRSEVNNMKSMAKTIASSAKKQKAFLEKFKAKLEKTLEKAKAAKASGEKQMKITPDMINADKETVKVCNIYLSVLKICNQSVEMTKTALVDAGAKKDKSESKGDK